MPKATKKEIESVEKAGHLRMVHETSKREFHAGRMSWEEFNRLQTQHREADKAMRKTVSRGFHRKLELELKAKYKDQYVAKRTK